MILLCSDAVTIVVNLIVAFVRTVTIHSCDGDLCASSLWNIW